MVRRIPASAKRLRAVDLRLRRVYGRSLADYNRVLLYQKRGCAICGKVPLPSKPRLAVDHCHTTGLLRGLLCWRCNRALIRFDDDVVKLLAAANYLTNPPFTVVFGAPCYTAPGRVGSRSRAKLLRKLKAAQ
jgi:recombination endonuclease VII